MVIALRVAAALLWCLAAAATAHAEVLFRWDRDAIPPRESLGIETVVIPAGNDALLRSARAAGYRVYVEVAAASLARWIVPAGIDGVVVKGRPSAQQVRQLRPRLAGRSTRVVVLDERAKWPHIRANWVTRGSNDVLQVTGRSAQPWIENNAALLRIARAAPDAVTPVLTYAWEPVTVAEKEEGPSIDSYLLAIAEAGSFGADLVLPLHARFQGNLLLGRPQARADWAEIQRHARFYSWNLPTRYEPIANIGVVTAQPVLWFETMNLLARHNLPFELIAPAELPKRDLNAIALLIVLDEPDAAVRQALAAFEAKGGRVKATTVVGDPNAFALEMRQLVGRERRIVDIWNGITVLTAPYVSPRAPGEPDGRSVLLTVLNYSAQPLPVQLRVAGTFPIVHYESPDEPLTLLPHEHRDGYTEFVVPALRLGGRVFLSHGSSRVP